MRGGPKGARERREREGRKGVTVATLAFIAALVVLGVVIPLTVFAGDKNRDSYPSEGIKELTSLQKHGQELFGQQCRRCHTLAASGAVATVGPNLDQLLVPSGTNSAELYDGNATRVLQAVLCGVPPGGARMPRGILEEEEAKEVAQFVGAYAGQIGKGPVVDTSETPPPEFDGCPTG